MKKQKIILFLSGGGMSGVFGAGVVSRLQELNFYDQIEAIYGSSAGVLNGAYFLTRQTALGSSIYWEDLIHNFVQPRNLLIGALQRIWNRRIKALPREKIASVIDIDYLFKFVEEKKRLNVEKLRSQKIPLFARLLDLKTGELKYVDVCRSDSPLRLIKAAVSIIPYYFPKDDLADGAVKEGIDLPYLLRRYPQQKIVLAINFSLKRNPIFKFFRFLEGLVAGEMVGPNFPAKKIFSQKEERLIEDIKEAQGNPNVLLISSAKARLWPFITNKEKILKTYEAGKEAAMQIIDLVRGI